MQKKMRKTAVRCSDVVFMPALMPLEAAVLPAQERKTYGVLDMIPCAYEAGDAERCGDQRAKIWVR